MTKTNPVSQQILFYGKDEPLPQQRLLKAGPLEMVYENGTVRYIRLKGFEVLRMIYPAVRDQNWGTVHPLMKNEKIVDRGNSFLVEFDSEYREGEIHFFSKYRIEGTETGKLKFEMKGQAHTAFKKTRI